MFDLIAAVDENNGIGKDDSIPWSLSKDLKYFQQLTSNSYIIMGRKTWESLPKKPLPNRINIIISSQNIPLTSLHFIHKYNPYTICCSNTNTIYIFNSLQLALDCIKNSECENIKNTFVIGGEQLYNEAIHYPDCNNIYITKIYKNFDCDKFFPSIPLPLRLMSVSEFECENNIYFRYLLYSKNSFNPYKNKEEHEYLRLLKRIIGTGNIKQNRTGIKSSSLFGERLKYDLRDTFPILTTRRQYFRGVFEELLFYLRGDTNNNNLVEKGVNVWTKNTTREFLDSRNLDYEVGDMGPTYGFNFRNFGGDYVDCNHEHKCGVDQLEQLIHTLKTDTDSRRMIITLWDPKNNKKSALPSCMCFYQFYVSPGNELNLQVYIRSSDFFLANNWNTCTAALFVHLLCNLEGIDMTPGDLTIVMGDVHVYHNQLEGIKSCLDRKPKPFPKLIVKSEKKNSITDFSFDDICLVGYEADKRVKVDMAV
tara:strand:- start:1 stop:1437 length:1437 start_codon:yes stop_codon:yes gene_type:complete